MQSELIRSLSTTKPAMVVATDVIRKRYETQVMLCADLGFLNHYNFCLI